MTIQFLVFTGGVAWLVRERSGDTPLGAEQTSAIAATEQSASGASPSEDLAESAPESTEPDVLITTSLPDPAGPDSSGTSVVDADSATTATELDTDSEGQTVRTDSGADNGSPATTGSVATTQPERTTTTTERVSEPSAETTSASTEPETSQTDSTAPGSGETDSGEAPATTVATPTVPAFDENAPIPVGIDVVFADGSPAPRVKVLLAPGKPGPADSRERSGFSEDGRLELDVLHGCYVVRLGSSSAITYAAAQQRRCFKDVGQRHLVTIVLEVRAARSSAPSGCMMWQNDNNTWRLTIWDDDGTLAIRYQARNESDDVWALQGRTPISMSDTTIVYEIPGSWWSTSPDEWLKVTGNSGQGNSVPVFCTLGR